MDVDRIARGIADGSSCDRRHTSLTKSMHFGTNIVHSYAYAKRRHQATNIVKALNYRGFFRFMIFRAATWLGKFFAKSVAPEALRFCQSLGHCVTPALWIITVKPFRRLVSAWMFGKTYSAPSSASAKSFRSSVSIAGNKGRIRTARFA